MDFTPERGDTSIHIPVTFDYQPGRSSNTKSKVFLSIGLVVVVVISGFIFFSSESLAIWQRILYFAGVCYIALMVLRFVVLKESHYSKMYEQLVKSDFSLQDTDFWRIFDISPVYPYICYFTNGRQGMFIRMERDALTGKEGDAVYNHYEAISDAYNKAHTLNMDIVHIDYMDNIGNDARLDTLYNDLERVKNPDMQDMLLDIYNNLEEEMSYSYTSYDIYLFITRDRVENLLYNVQQVASIMLGGNFITYRVLNKAELSGVCTALFNFNDFSINEACEKLVRSDTISGIVPISIKHSNGQVEKLNNTVAEKEELQRQAEERAMNAKKAKAIRKADAKKQTSVDEEIDLF